MVILQRYLKPELQNCVTELVILPFPPSDLLFLSFLPFLAGSDLPSHTRQRAPELLQQQEADLTSEPMASATAVTDMASHPVPCPAGEEPGALPSSHGKGS